MTIMDDAKMRDRPVVDRDGFGRERELEAARRLARAAGAAAMPFYGTAVAMQKTGGSPVTQADHAANDVIRAGLEREFPADAILSEESADSPARLDAERVWIVDPLDGTKEFLAQNGEFAIMIGLAVQGEPVVGAVYLPAHDVLYSAARGAGAEVERAGRRERLHCPTAGAQAGSMDSAHAVDATESTDSADSNGSPSSVDAVELPGAAGWSNAADSAGTASSVDPASLRLVGSRSHSDPLLLRMQQALGISDVRPSGSVGVKCALIAEAERDLYIHPVPYLKEWDTCAPEIVLREAGGDVVDCSGERLRYNKPDPRQPDGIVACAPGTLGLVLDRIGPLYAASVAAGG